MIISVKRYCGIHSTTQANWIQEVEIDTDNIKGYSESDSFWHDGVKFAVVRFKNKRPCITMRMEDLDSILKSIRKADA